MKKIVLTAGDPAGIGPDLCVLLAQKKAPAHCRLILVADPHVLSARAQCLNTTFTAIPYQKDTEPQRALEIIPLSYPESVVPSILDPRNIPVMMAGLDRAIDGCLRGEFDALVTNPISKSNVRTAGLSFIDHTQYLKKKCRVPRVVMTFIGSNHWCVSLMTAHRPLRDVARALSIDGIEETLTIIDHDLSCYRQKKPRIAVCGLNPHAGEDGHLGREEIEIIAPAVLRAQKKGIQCWGPLSADTLFCHDQRILFDVILACYHDQGLAPFKLANFPGGTNITLGLPFIRTSVDHGTALDRAGTGAISLQSLEESIDWAYQYSMAREHHGHT